MILEISSFLNTQDILNLIVTNKFTKNVFYEFGFLQHLNVRERDNDFETNLNKINNHFRTLTSVLFEKIDNNQMGIYFDALFRAKAIKELFLVNCNLPYNSHFISKRLTKLVVNNNDAVIINFNLFSSLKYLHIESALVECVGIDKLVDSLLENVIFKCYQHTVLPVELCLLKNLVSLYSNCWIEEQCVTFESEILIVLLVRKKYPFKSKSKFLPAIHLGLCENYN